LTASASLKKTTYKIGEITLKESGISADRVITKNWRATSAHVTSLITNIKIAIGLCSEDEVVLVLGMFNNSFFQALYEYGNYCPKSKQLDGSFHVDGDIACPATGTSRRSFLQIIPLWKAFAEYNKLVLASIPRYLYSSCCDDIEHAPNIKTPGHPDSQVAEIEEHQRMWRGICFREKTRTIKVVSAGHLIKESPWWRSDSVHPTKEGYDRT
jgi:hypothetical protein